MPSPKQPAYPGVRQSLASNPKHWLVTGAAGFIGSHLVETLLGLGQRVTGFDNFATGHQANIDQVLQAAGDAAESFSFIEGSIADPDACAQAVRGADYVLHQAALGSVPRSIDDPAATNVANVDGFLQMLIAARDAKVERFVYASSSAVYGDSPGLPKVEQEIGNSLSPYAVSKHINELYSRNFGLVYGTETVGLRYFNVFGPRQDPNGAYAAVIPEWIDLIASGSQCVCYGDGETSRDFCYIDNVVQANILSAVTPGIQCEVFNIAVGGQTSLTELYGMLAREVERIDPKRKPPALQYETFRSGDVRHSLADISKASSGLGYAPEVTIDEGIKRTVDWFLKN